MEIISRCPSCGYRVAFDPVAARDAPIHCERCSEIVPLSVSASLVEQNRAESCPCCGKNAFYVQRDFNRNLGLAVVVLCALAGLLFVYYDRPALFYASLGVGVLVDLVLYLLLPEVTICYACQAIFRGATTNPAHGAFDLHMADHFEGRSCLQATNLLTVKTIEGIIPTHT